MSADVVSRTGRFKKRKTTFANESRSQNVTLLDLPEEILLHICIFHAKITGNGLIGRVNRTFRCVTTSKIYIQALFEARMGKIRKRSRNQRSVCHVWRELAHSSNYRVSMTVAEVLAEHYDDYHNNLPIFFNSKASILYNFIELLHGIICNAPSVFDVDEKRYHIVERVKSLFEHCRDFIEAGKFPGKTHKTGRYSSFSGSSLVAFALRRHALGKDYIVDSEGIMRVYPAYLMLLLNYFHPPLVAGESKVCTSLEQYLIGLKNKAIIAVLEGCGIPCSGVSTFLSFEVLVDLLQYSSERFQASSKEPVSPFGAISMSYTFPHIGPIMTLSALQVFGKSLLRYLNPPAGEVMKLVTDTAAIAQQRAQLFDVLKSYFASVIQYLDLEGVDGNKSWTSWLSIQIHSKRLMWHKHGECSLQKSRGKCKLHPSLGELWVYDKAILEAVRENGIDFKVYFERRIEDRRCSGRLLRKWVEIIRESWGLQKIHCTGLVDCVAYFEKYICDSIRTGLRKARELTMSDTHMVVNCSCSDVEDLLLK